MTRTSRRGMVFTHPSFLLDDERAIVHTWWRAWTFETMNLVRKSARETGGAVQASCGARLCREAVDMRWPATMCRVREGVAVWERADAASVGR
jgi:hypothetical protein